MRKFVNRPRSAAVGILGLLALTGASFSTSAVPANAEGAPVLRSAYGSHTQSTYASKPRVHNSSLTISARDRLPMTKSIVIGQSKSVLVELPRNLRDVLTSDPEVVDAVVQTSNRVFLIGKKIGQANAFFIDEFGEKILTLEMSVEPDMRGITDMLNRLLPGANVKVESLNESFILTGSVRNAADANVAQDMAARAAVTIDPRLNKASGFKVINLLQVEGGEQVMLKVHIMEVARTVLKQFGMNVGAAVSAGNFSTALLTNNALPLTSALGLGTLPTPGIIDGGLSNFNTGGQSASNGPFFGNSGLSSGWSNGQSAVSNALRALERVGLVKTLSEPSLVAISGEKADFLAGGSFPIPVVGDEGNLNVDYRRFGVALAFTPNVLSEGRINLAMKTEVSELSSEGSVTLSNIQIPALSQRTAQTVVELPSGGSLAIAGLVSRNTRQNVDGLPGLKDLPILGTLFRSKDFVDEETELLIIVTPYIVKPVARHKLSGPGQGLHPATDMKRNLLGQLQRRYGTGTVSASGGLKGDYGFIVE